MTNREFALTASLIADKANVRCVQHMSPSWMANVDAGVIYYPYKGWYTDADIGFLIHEASHIRFSTISHQMMPEFRDWVEKTGKVGEQVWTLVNSLEDIRIEAEICKVYSGARYFLDLSSEQSWESMCEITDYHQYIGDGMYEEQQAKKWLHFNMHFLWQAASGPVRAKEYYDIWQYDPLVATAIKGAQDSVPKILDCATTQDLIKLIQDEVLVHYMPLCDDIDPDEKKALEKLKELLKELGELLQMVSDARAEAKKAMPGDKSESEIKADAEEVAGLDEVDTKAHDGEELEKIKADKLRRTNDTTREDKPQYNSHEIFDRQVSGHLDESQLDEFVRLNMARTKKAVSILKDLEINRFSGSFDSGKLVNRRLFKLKTGAHKIFTRKVELNLDDKDMVFMVLVDESGSMHGYGHSTDEEIETGYVKSKNQQACISTTVLAKALESCNKRYAITGFNRYLWKHKEFEEKLDYKKMLKIETNALGNGSGDNSDGWAVNEMTAELLKQPEHNKILIVLSDGQPSPSHDHAHYDLREEVKNAERAGIKVYSIGIDSDAVKRYYSRYTVINNPAQLGDELTKIFEENIGKRIR